jgi:demethylmenaquinone methyltransferase / 2-methoxy-6-polyprenyl-1,4-benzoquinol methylase
MPFHLPTSEDKAEYVQHQFNRIARGYDLANDAISIGMHRIWKRTAVDILNPKPDGEYLDVCCGTGDLTLMIARHLGAQGKVVGLDFSEKMLAVAQERAHGKAHMRSHGAVEFVQGDAQDLPFSNGSFDGAIISFGLRNLTDLQRGLDQMTRVVRPGGHVINLDLGHSTIPLFSPLFKVYFRQIVPVMGRLLQNDEKAYTYLPESLNTYPKPRAITEMFQKAGLISVRHIPLALGSVALHVGTVPAQGAAQ